MPDTLRRGAFLIRVVPHHGVHVENASPFEILNLTESGFTGCEVPDSDTEKFAPGNAHNPCSHPAPAEGGFNRPSPRKVGKGAHL
jgi:hypothetical protein